MAGHSKWSNTKHRKAIQDNKKSKMFTKILKNLTNIVKLKGKDINTNSNLRAAIDYALSNNISRDIINRTISRSSFDNKNNLMFHAIYEGYGPGGIAIITECISDNLNRTVSEIRHIFTKNEVNLTSKGSVDFLFQKYREIKFTPTDDEDILFKITQTISVKKLIKENDNCNTIIIDYKEFNIVENILSDLKLKILSSEIIKIPYSKIKINKINEEKLLNLIKILKNSKDVKKIYHNAIL